MQPELSDVEPGTSEDVGEGEQESSTEPSKDNEVTERPANLTLPQMDDTDQKSVEEASEAIDLADIEFKSTNVLDTDTFGFPLSVFTKVRS